MPPLSEEQVVVVMEQELGVPWEDVFDHVEPEPLAAGTIAQVHRAVMANGAKAVIKVQRPDARELIEQDLALLEVFADKAGDRPGLKQVIDLKAVFEHLSTSLHRELDFRNEARNVERMREVIAPFDRLAVPSIYQRILDRTAARDGRRRRRPDHDRARGTGPAPTPRSSCSSPSTSRSWSTASSTPTRTPAT